MNLFPRGINESRDKFSLSFGLILGVIVISSSAFMKIGGDHLWKIAESYGFIMGYMSQKNFLPFDLHLIGHTSLVNMPFYEITIAFFAKLFKTDPLVLSRYLNVMLWILTFYSIIIILDKLKIFYSVIFFSICFVTSPLILHYYSHPLPDLMSISFSLFSFIFLVSDKKIYKLFGIFLITIATLVKSPIVFIFLWFYFTFVTLEKIFIEKISVKNFISSNKNLIFFSFYLLFIALLSENLRNFLQGNYSLTLAKQSQWYFGDFNLRFSLSFFNRIFERINSINFFNSFFIIYFLLILITQIYFKSLKLFLINFSAISSYFIGWAIFASVYYNHNYYQIPGSIILIISASSCIKLIFKNCWNEKFNNLNLKFFMFMIVIFYLFLLLFQNSMSDRNRLYSYQIPQYLLNDQDYFLHVTEHAGPHIAGLVNTRVKRVKKTEFEDKCAYFIENNKNILSDYDTECLSANKNNAYNFISTNDFVFYQQFSKKFDLCKFKSNGIKCVNNKLISIKDKDFIISGNYFRAPKGHKTIYLNYQILTHNNLSFNNLKIEVYKPRSKQIIFSHKYEKIRKDINQIEIPVFFKENDVYELRLYGGSNYSIFKFLSIKIE